MEIRPITLKDSDAFLMLMNTNRNRLKNYFPILTKSVTDKESTINYIKEKQQQQTDKASYTFVMLSEKNEIIGCLIIKNINWATAKAELAYYIDKKQEGKGITSLGVSWIIDYCFSQLQLKSLFLRIDPKNIGSKTVALKNGFVLEKIVPNDFTTADNRLIDIEYYGLKIN